MSITSKASKKRSDTVFLNFQTTDGQIVVTPSNEDRFVIKMQRGIEVLQRSNEADKYTLQFNLLLKTLAGWIEDQKEIESAHITIRDGSLAFVVVRKKSQYDGDFEDRLSAIDVEIANDVDLDLIELEVIALPHVSGSSLKSFLHPEVSFAYKNVKSD